MMHLGNGDMENSLVSSLVHLVCLLDSSIWLVHSLVSYRSLLVGSLVCSFVVWIVCSLLS